MDNWYFVDDKGQRQGPVTAQAIADLFKARDIHSDTLAWREGLSEWLPLGGFLDELDLSTPTPPLPLSPLPMEQVSRNPQTAPWPASASAPPEPLGHAANVIYAGFWRRYLALLVDQFVLGIPLLLLVGGLGYTLGLFEGAGEEAGTLVQAVYFLSYFVTAPLYYALQESSRHQATLGKRVLGIKVTDLEGNRIGFSQALGRWFAAALSYLTMYIGFLMAAFTARKQALHDMVASTLVTDKWAFTAHPERQKQGLSGCLVAILVVLVAGIPLLAILAAIAIPAYQTYVTRSTVAQAVVTAQSVSLAVSEFQAEYGRCPTNGEGGLGDSASYATDHVASIQVGPMQDKNRCSIQVTFKPGTNGSSAGKNIRLEQDGSTGTWHCASDMEDRNLPSNCRG